MSKLLKVFSGLLLGFGMASAFGQTADPRFDAFMQTVSGNKTTVTFGGGGVPIATSSAPLGTPSVQGMGFTRTAEGVFMESIGSARVPGTNTTVPVQTKLKLSGQVIGKTLAKASLAYTLWESGSALYDIWSDVGLTLGPDGSVSDSAAGTGQQSDGYQYRVGQNPFFLTRELACNWYVNNIANAGATYYRVYVGVTTSDGNGFGRCLMRYPQLNADSWENFSRSTSTCPTTHFISNGQCTPFNPSAPLTEQQLSDRIAQQSGWPDSTISSALADAIALPGIAPQIAPEIEAQPEKPVVQVQSAPGPVTIGDPVTETVVTTNPDGSTSTREKTTVTTLTPVGNDLVKTEESTETITTRAPDGTVTGVTTNTSTSTPAAPAEQVVPCGLPDSPACRIDETDTPEPVEDDSQTIVDELVQPLVACMNDPLGCLPTLPDINWAFTFPSTCGDISMGSGYDEIGMPSIDICQYQPTIHDILSMLWAAAGLFGAIGMVSASNRQEG